MRTRPQELSVARQEAERLVGLIAKRGPDGDGVRLALEGRIGFAHSRLAVIDPGCAADQPMLDPGSGAFIAYNGEIYNFAELRQRLRASGVQFRTRSDTEVLLKGFLFEGAAFFEKLRGMYAFVIFDPATRTVVAARDPQGLKPLYLYIRPDEVRFGSSPAAACPEFDRALDPAAAVSVAVLGAVLEPLTPLRRVTQLAPGSCCRISLRPGRVDVQTTALEPIFPWTASAGQGLDTLVEALSQSVAAHLTSDVPVAIFQSAGLDSTALSTLAERQGARPTLLTVGFAAFRETEADEVPGAARVASALGLTHKFHYFTEPELEHHRVQFLQDMTTPTADAFNTYLAAYLAKSEGVKVVLSGVGGDELLAGYPSFRQLPRLNLVGSLMGSPAVAMAAKGALSIAARLAKRRSQKLRYAAGYLADWSRRYLLRRAQYLPEELPQLLDPEVARAGLPRFWNAFETLASRSTTTDEAGVRVLESDIYMRNMLLRDADWAGMAHGIEIRTPFVDVPLSRALCDPADRCGYRKEHLRLLANSLQPALDLAPRRKTGFMVPQRSASGGGASQPLFGARGIRDWNRKVLKHWFGEWVL